MLGLVFALGCCFNAYYVHNEVFDHQLTSLSTIQTQITTGRALHLELRILPLYTDSCFFHNEPTFLLL